MKISADVTKFALPLIETKRFLLRMFEDRDLDSMFQLFNDEEVQKYLAPENRRTRRQLETTLQNLARHWKERGFGLWCVSEKSGGQMFGYCGFQHFDKTSDVEILFGFLKDFWGNGFATEAANACLKFGFEELRFKKVYAATHPENTASSCVLEKVGMVFEKRTTHYGLETITYSISRSSFEPFEDFYKLKYKNSRLAATCPNQELSAR